MRRLLGWYRAHRRDLPWRRTHDPYRIWLSEAMLQQTRVDTVVPFYERFLESFPTAAALATADEDDVLREWAGLGYYARARNLKRAAEIIVRDHGGRVPRSTEALRALPGVGRYTAGAVQSIAFQQRAAVVDGNVARVLSRLEALRSPTDTILWQIAEDLVPEDSPGDFNQALMELGARLCTPAPACTECPMTTLCGARKTGAPERFPAKRVRKRPIPMRAIAGVVHRDGGRRALLIVRRPSRGLLGGLWELPNVEGSDPSTLRAMLREQFGIRTTGRRSLGRVEHAFTHRALTLDLIELRHTGGALRPASEPAKWCSRSELKRIPLSTLMKKSLSKVERPSARTRSS